MKAITISDVFVNWKQKHKSSIQELKYTIHQFLQSNLSVLGAIIIICFLSVALFAPYLAPADPLEQDMKSRLQAPSSNHLLGTDSLGRDILSRVIYGTRTSVMIAVMVINFLIDRRRGGSHV